MSCRIKKEDQFPSGSVQVRIPVIVQGQYQMQDVTLYSVDDMHELKGATAKFLISPLVQDGKLTGQAPQIQTVRNSAGVYLATNTFSLELLSLYYHTEQMSMMDERVGARDLNSWPRTMAVSVNVTEQGQSVQDNALYSGDLDAMLVVPYSRENDLPISINAGILAHEHFHSLFYKLVTLKLRELNLTLHDQKQLLKSKDRSESPQLPEMNTPTPQFYNLYLLRALNEGLADFWAWLYTQDDQFVSRSLPEEFESRRLDKTISLLQSADCFRGRLLMKNEPASARAAYALGTEFARGLRQISLKSERKPKDLQKVYGSAILRSLTRFAVMMTSLKTEEVLEPRKFLELFKSEISVVSKAESDSLGRLIESSQSGICR